MKTRQTKKTKIKVLKTGPKQTKAKLPEYKRKNKFIKVKQKSAFKALTMNSSYSSTKNSLHSEEQDTQSIKRKKKKTCSDSSTASYSMDLSLESRDESAEIQTSRDKNTKQYHAISEQQRNLGSPVIVEALSETLSSLSIPEGLKQSHKLTKDNNNCNYNPSRTWNTYSENDEPCIIVGESVNPNNRPYVTENNSSTVTSSKNNSKQRKSKTPLKTKNTDSNTWDSNEPSTTFEECLENIRIDRTISSRSLSDVETDTFTLKKNKNSIPNKQCSLRFYCLRNKVLVVMPKKTQFCFTGKIVLKVIYGAVEVYGYLINIDTKPMEIYSPRGYSSISIKASNKFSQEIQPDVWTSLSIEGITRDIENKLVADLNNLQAGTTVVLLSNLENKLTKFLNVFYPFRLFPSIRNVSYQTWTDPKRAEVILQSNLYVGNYTCKELIIDQCITQEVSEAMLNYWRVNKWSCTLIAGGKSVGKSTSARHLINSLLLTSKKVVLVDVDPGQTECTPAGCISYSLIEEPLMGPNFTHLRPPAFQLYIGDVNVSRCLTRYIEGIKMLVDKLSSCPVMSRLPIVVNTMGFTHGIGWDIVIFTTKLIQPSLVVQIMSEKSKSNFPNYLSKEVINEQELTWASWSANVLNWNQPCNHKLYVIQSHAERKSTSVNETWNMEPYQQRELVLISYLSEIVQNPMDSTSCYDAISLSINAAVPYVTPISSLTISVPQTSVPPSHVLNVVNGNIVALCGIDIENAELQTTDLTSGPRILNRIPLCSCYGFGIVRGIDTEREEIFINTPLSAEIMQCVNCLVGCIPVPVTLLQLNQHRNVPYTGGDNALPTSREHRRGYFRMRYQNMKANS
nr:polynucleotide 5'-hydroxyl-kinase NOL9 isoform X1 [Nomia melanderi]